MATRTSKTPPAKKAPARLQSIDGAGPNHGKRGKVPPSQNAKALYRFLQTEWDRMGVLPTPWCRENGIPDPTVMRWKAGTEPDMRSLRKVAQALGRSVLDILIAAEYITPEEAGGHVPQPIILDARVAIQTDERIDPVLAEAMLRLWDSWEDVMAGVASKITTKVGGARGTRSRTQKSV